MACRVGNRAFIYVLSCADGTWYTGWTHDLSSRVRAHQQGVASRYTRSRLPIRLLAWGVVESSQEARSVEARFKRLNRTEKQRALSDCKAFGVDLHNAPRIENRLRGDVMPAKSPPVGDELRTLLERARASRARIATAKGDIVFEFFPDDAPQHCAAFVKLVGEGFYDGLAFHRVEPGFVVQGGDPSGDGTGGPGYRLKAEFNARPHVRGTVAMARANDPDSAGSQFYICLGDARFLDRQYTVFGQMVSGDEALDAIRRGDKMAKVTIEPVVTN